MKLLGFADPSREAPQRPIEAPHLHTEGLLTVALQGGPVYLDGKPVATPAPAIAAAYQSRGVAFLSRLTGRFALAVADRAAGRVLLALDRMGMERLTYARLDNGLVFSSSAEAVSRYPGVAAPLRLQSIFDYLLLHMIPAPHTVYRGVSKLRPGTVAVLENGTLRVERYWQPRFATNGAANFEDLRQELHESLKAAVADCEPGETSGAFLSGGLDSSTVVGVLSRVALRPPRTFSIGFGVQEFNEIEYARIASRRFNAVAHEYDVTADDVVDAFERIAAAYDEPFGNSSAIPTYYCARIAAQHGITHMLAGDGGDELFAGNERYARQKIFEAYWRLPQGLRKGLIQPMVSVIDPESRIMPARKLRSYVDQASIPMPERLESWNYMYRIDLGGMLEPAFRAAIDTRAPLATMAEVYAQAPSNQLVHRMLFYDWHYTLSDNDLRKVGTMCELAGVRVSYPMLDPRVIDLSLRVPLNLMARGLQLRTFYKRAMQGFLPDEILNKKKHGFGLPFGVWLKTHPRLRDLIYALLNGLKGRGIVRPEFLDDLVKQHQDGHPGYYGYAIWDLAMLEAWLEAHTGNGPVH